MKNPFARWGKRRPDSAIPASGTYAVYPPRQNLIGKTRRSSRPPLGKTRRTLSGRRVPVGFVGARDWHTLVQKPKGDQPGAVHGVRNARLVPKRIRECPDPASLAVIVDGTEFSGMNRETARRAGARRTGYAKRAAMREVTARDVRIDRERSRARVAKRSRRSYGVPRADRAAVAAGPPSRRQAQALFEMLRGVAR